MCAIIYGEGGNTIFWWAAGLSQCNLLMWVPCGSPQQYIGAKPAWSVGVPADLGLVAGWLKT